MFNPFWALGGGEGCGKGQESSKSQFLGKRPTDQQPLPTLAKINANIKMTHHPPTKTTPHPALPKSLAPNGAPVRPAPDSRSPKPPEAVQCARGESGESAGPSPTEGNCQKDPCREHGPLPPAGPSSLTPWLRESLGTGD